MYTGMTTQYPEEIELAEPHDLYFRGRCLRVFYRGWHCSQWPYCFHRWGLYAFGLLCVGFMFWPKRAMKAPYGF